MATTADRAAFVQEEFRSAVWQSTPVRTAYGKVARDTGDEAIVSFFDNVADAKIIIDERGALLGAHARRFRTTVDKVLAETELPMSPALAAATFVDDDLVANMPVAIAAMEAVDFDGERTTLVLWGTVGAAPVQDAPTP